MRSRQWAAPAAGALAVAIALTGPATAMAGPRTCDRVRGKDLSPSPRTKLVYEHEQTARFTGRRLVGCVLPHGTVRLVGRQGTYPDAGAPDLDVALQIVRTAATAVQVRETTVYDIDTAHVQVIDFVDNLLTDTRRDFFTENIGEAELPADRLTRTPPPAKVVFGPSGQFVVLFALEHEPTDADRARYGQPDLALLIAYPNGKTARRLEIGGFNTIPVASVTTAGRTVHWRNHGVPGSGVF